MIRRYSRPRHFTAGWTRPRRPRRMKSSGLTPIPSPPRPASSVRAPPPAPAPPAGPVGGGGLGPREVDDAVAERLGRGRDGLPSHVPEAGHLGVAAVDEVERDLGAEARRGDAEAGIAERVRGAAAE